MTESDRLFRSKASFVPVRPNCKTCRCFPQCLVSRAAFGKTVCALETDTDDVGGDALAHAPHRDDLPGAR